MDTKVFLFPLSNSILYKKVTLPYHIFEERYQKMVRDAIATQTPIAIVPMARNEEYKGTICVAGIPHILTEYPNGQMDIYITGSTKCKLTSHEIDGSPYKVYSYSEVPESIEVDDSCIMELESLRLMINSWSREYLPDQHQRDIFARSLNDEELLVNYCSVFLLNETKEKEAVMKANSLKEKINILLQILGPKEIRISEFMPVLKF